MGAVQELLVPSNPVIEKICLNKSDSTLTLILRPDVMQLKNRFEHEPAEESKYNALSQLIYDEIAKNISPIRRNTYSSARSISH